MPENQLIPIIILITASIITISASIFVFITARPHTHTPNQNSGFSYQEQYDKLKLFIEENQKQNTSIYRLTVIFITAGFFIIIFGVGMSVVNENINSQNHWVVIVAGVITEFIATTVLFVYRSVFHQTSEYFKAIERFSTVGLALSILNEIQENDPAISVMKTQSKIETAKKILDIYNSENISETQPNSQTQRK